MAKLKSKKMQTISFYEEKKIYRIDSWKAKSQQQKKMTCRIECNTNLNFDSQNYFSFSFGKKTTTFFFSIEDGKLMSTACENAVAA
jgi:hypothetical protein